VNNAAEQALVSARDVRALGQSFEIARSTTTQSFSKEALKVLLVSLPGRGWPDPMLRREEEFISGLADNYSDDVVFDRQEVSEIAHINDVLCSSTYDIIHFSGQRDSDDLFLESSFIHQQLTMHDADRCLHALECAPRLPKVVVSISCFSRRHANLLSRCAPFVIRTDLSVGDAERVAFVEHFYANLFATQSVTGSFAHATQMLRIEGLFAEAFTLHRPELTGKGASLYIRCFPPGDEYGIAINMDAVADEIDDLGMTREEVLHRIAWRMPIDRRVLNGARDDALIPIGDVLLGFFSWKNREDVHCNKLARLTSVPEEQLNLWRALLKSYNILAASKYRNLQRPTDPAFKYELKTAVTAFESSIEDYLLGSSDSLVRLGFRRLLPHLARAETECMKASDRLLVGDYRGVVLALETALTHYHTVVSGIQPPAT
jgi:hypothetical protein